jgi:D-amino-acid oxidase
MLTIPYLLGQTVLTDLETTAKTITKQRKDGSWSFIIPRFFNGGTIIGGTKDPNDWQNKPRRETRHRLLEASRDILTYALDETNSQDTTMGTLNVISDIVGRRPAREGGMRIEIESQSTKTRNAKDIVEQVIHAYGAGGRGYELSWGVATEVGELAKQLLAQRDHVRSRL